MARFIAVHRVFFAVLALAVACSLYVFPATAQGSAPVVSGSAKPYDFSRQKEIRKYPTSEEIEAAEAESRKRLHAQIAAGAAKLEAESRLWQQKHMAELQARMKAQGSSPAPGTTPAKPGSAAPNEPRQEKKMVYDKEKQEKRKQRRLFNLQ